MMRAIGDWIAAHTGIVIHWRRVIYQAIGMVGVLGLIALVFVATVVTVDWIEATWGETQTVLVEYEERCGTDISGFEQCVEVAVTPHTQTHKVIEGAWFGYAALGLFAVYAIAATYLANWLDKLVLKGPVRRRLRLNEWDKP